MVRRNTTQKCVAALVVMALSGSLQAQEMFNVNVWNIGRPASRGGIFGDGVDDDLELVFLTLDGATPAGAPGWNTVQWENVELDPNPFAKLTPATIITGTSGSTATFEMFNRRNAAPYQWNAIRDYSDDEDTGNAILLDGHVNSTEFDGANGDGNPFGFQISDFEIRDIPFASYDAVIYFGINGGQTFLGNGTIRINDDLDRPSDPTDWGNSVIAEGPLEMTGGAQFTLPTSLQDFEPDGTLDEIEFSGDTGNFIVFTDLTGSTLAVQTWGEAFTHLGISGFQIREVEGIAPRAGDFDDNGVFDVVDVDALVGEITAMTNDTGFDLTTDGTVDQADLSEWLAAAATANGFAEPYLTGDANLDGTVNASDLNNMALNWQGSPNTWFDGDFTADGIVNASDLNELALSWQQSIAPAAAVHTVPEPSGVLLLMVGLLTVVGRVRRVT